MSPATRKVTKETPLGDGEVSIKQKQSRTKNDQTVRLLLDFNISPSPKTPPPLCARPKGEHERGFVTPSKVNPSAAAQIAAVILIKALALSAKPSFPEGKASLIIK